MSGNVCIACGGTGQRWSGVAYMGTREVVGCDECWGTGFDDVAAGVDDLRAQLAALREKIDAALPPVVSMVLTIALAQLNRGEDVTPNLAAVCIGALGEIRAALSDDQEGR